MENSFIIRDNFLMVDIRSECNNIILVLNRDIKPILKTLEIWDVAHIKECLESECADLSFIYSAAVQQARKDSAPLRKGQGTIFGSHFEGSVRRGRRCLLDLSFATTPCSDVRA